MEPLGSELQNFFPVKVDKEDDNECDKVRETDVSIEHSAPNISDTHGTEHVHVRGFVLDIVDVVNGDKYAAGGYRNS